MKFLRPVCLFLCLIFVAPLLGESISSWPIFRGTPAQTGASTTNIADKLEVLWSFYAGDGVEATPVHDGKTAYLGTLDGKFHAVNLTDGKALWTVKTGPIRAAACIVADLVVVGDTDGKIVAFDKAKGTIKWTLDTMGEISGGANTDGTSILQGTHDNSLYCLDLLGKVRWKFPMEGPFYGTPAIAGGKTFAAGCDSTLHIIEIETGKEVASVALNGQTGASASILGDKLYVGTMSKEVQAIQIKQAKADWAFSPNVRPAEFRSSAVATPDMVIIGARDKRVHALDAATGKPRWSYLTGGWVDGSPVVASKKVIAPSLDGNLYVLGLEKGELLQKVVLDGPIAGSVALAGNRVLVASDRKDDKGGTLFLLGGK